MDRKTTDVDLLSVALVREYLSRKGYKTTLNQFDKESKKRENSIQNRKVLAQELGIMELVIRNKERGLEALKSFLEMIVCDILSSKSTSNQPNRRITPVNSRRSRTRTMSGGKINLNNSIEPSPTLNKTMPSMKSLQKDIIDLDFIPAANKSDIVLNTSPSRLANIALESENANSSPTALSTRRKKLVHNIMMQEPSKSPRISMKNDSLLDHSVNHANTKSSSFIETGKNCKIGSPNSKPSYCQDTRENPRRNSVYSDHDHKKTGYSNNKRKNDGSDGVKATTELTMSIVDAASDDLYDLDTPDTYEDELTCHFEDINLATAIRLKVLLLGSATRYFNKEWTQQGFQFCQDPFLRYGLVQEKGGPCGLLASVQAVILKHLLFMSVDQKFTNGTLPQPNPTQQKAILTNALADILQSISRNKSIAIVALPSRSSKFTPNREYKNDNFTEKLHLYHLSPDREVKKFISKNILYFMNSNGCLLFLYSVVLSYGIENVRNTMDESDGTLIGSHGYCTQEMVNMLLTGIPVSNVFDGVVELDSGGQHMLALHGIQAKNDIGFLSLFEHYQSCKVGDNYKNPNYPIWVVCSESHFSILFSPVYLTNEKSTFDLYYYDGLGRQDEEIRLTVSLKRTKPKLCSNNELIPPLEHCIRTKWNSAIISWNGSEPIL